MASLTLILGAPDPEMNAIEDLGRQVGAEIRYALSARGTRVRADEAYQTVGITASLHMDRRSMDAPLPPGTVYAVECDGPAIPADAIRIDHHRPGDPGYGRPPSEFLSASSIGQVIAELARIGRLPMGPLVSSYEWVGDWEERQRAAFRWFHWEAEARTAFSGGALFEMFRTPYRLAPCDGYYILARRVSGVVEFAASPDEMRDAGAVRVAPDMLVRVHIPHDLVLAAAADHCLGAAYRGECPGVDPDALMRWRVESRAAFQRRAPAEILADIEAAREILREAPLVRLATEPWEPACGVHGRSGACWQSGAGDPTARTDECYALGDPLAVVDLRGRSIPELPEASAREGICFVADLPSPDGRVKVVCQSGSPEQIEAFMTVWAPAQGLTDIYGDPAQGFAGGYRS